MAKSLLAILASGLLPRMKTMNSVATGAGNGGWHSVIRESFGGAWQSGITVDSPKNILAFSAVFASVTVIASDIAKMRINVVEEDANGITKRIRNSSVLKVIRKPNAYQNRIKFFEQWVVSKLLYGNAYVLIIRDNERKIIGLHVLDPTRVTPLLTEAGEVYYQLGVNHVSGLQMPLTVPATEIIHDKMVCLWHPLIGVSPIYACGVSATMGNRIQANSTEFFGNMSRPSGMLTAPGQISEEVAARLKEYWEENFTRANIGRMAVMGDGLTYEAMTIDADSAQLIEQLKWTVEDVARCFHIPLYKIGGEKASGDSIEKMNQTYYQDCLHSIIESLEMSLDIGFDMPPARKIEMNLDDLLRMDKSALIKSEAEGVKGGIITPNESRARLNLKPLPGGDTAYLQQQNFSLEALGKRDAKEDPFATGSSAPPPASGGVSITNEGAVEMSVPGMDNVAQMMGRLDATLKAPVVPILNEDGKIIGSKRVAAEIEPETDDAMDFDFLVSSIEERFLHEHA